MLGTLVLVFGGLMVLSSWMGFGFLCFVWPGGLCILPEKREKPKPPPVSAGGGFSVVGAGGVSLPVFARFHGSAVWPVHYTR